MDLTGGCRRLHRPLPQALSRRRLLSTTGDVLNPTQEHAFERYIQAGGGYVGIHSATDTEYGWPWYGKLAGALL
ncbi:MAG: ThuA domain-containing protein [Gemmatimonadetes bacterium]|nr:ThuA domain-containing protein [Gemmatimonadota bacterium]